MYCHHCNVLSLQLFAHLFEIVLLNFDVLCCAHVHVSCVYNLSAYSDSHPFQLDLSCHFPRWRLLSFWVIKMHFLKLFRMILSEFYTATRSHTLSFMFFFLLLWFHSFILAKSLSLTVLHIWALGIEQWA